jgi:hypothetical protein
MKRLNTFSCNKDESKGACFVRHFKKDGLLSLAGEMCVKPNLNAESILDMRKMLGNKSCNVHDCLLSHAHKA